ncbi:hypothetical protein DMH04_00795 [Kibdelosporangium aridum]|uniref:Uncharacterized protein n=1 Tax=Kibdelosporangium aridum TaxID=2030 RepID=A0A428ZU70_KIBAR|nr:hypothetical protein [Kibdelosporangium aridum]RSM91567.1 hypothetical protein DMH04_00795 [Kibdelosporangium aridum]
MRARNLIGLTAVLAFIATPAVALAGDSYPHPTPFGPQRPYEPDVAGPVNIDRGSVTYTEDGGSRYGVKISFTSQRSTTTGVEPAAARQFVFLFDRSVHFNPYMFPTCDRSVIAKHGAAACPEGSQVGSGRAVFFRGGESDVLVFNTTFDKGLRGVLIHIPVTGAILENTLERVVGHYRDDYGWGLNEILPVSDVPPQERPSTKEFYVTFGAVYKGQSFVRSFARPGAELAVGVWSEYVTGQTTLVEGTITRP